MGSKAVTERSPVYIITSMSWLNLHDRSSALDPPSFHETPLVAIIVKRALSRPAGYLVESPEARAPTWLVLRRDAKGAVSCFVNWL
jgi:hypothetical protein